jgi:hypothetical protein
MDPNKTSQTLGHSNCMGPELRRFVERQLVADLNQYLSADCVIKSTDVHFDWSDSCVEGHRSRWLDGEIENFSGVAIRNHRQELVAEGWMEFIETEGSLEVFWWFLRGGDDYAIQDKNSNHVPEHIWARIGDDVRSLWSRFAPDTARITQ